MSWDIFDLAGEVAGPQQVRQLFRLIKRLFGIEELFGELAASAQLGDADLGSRDLAELVCLVAGEQTGDFIAQALALGEFFEVVGGGQFRFGLRTLSSWLPRSRRRPGHSSSKNGNKTSSLILVNLSMISAWALSSAKATASSVRTSVKRPQDRRRQLGLAGEEVVG